MALEFRWLGHGSWQIQVDGLSILLDPFLNDNPSAPVKAEAVDADIILVSHGHFDHVADVASIANRTEATVVAIYEIAQWFANNHNVSNTIGMNIGGQVQLPFGTAKMTPALHSASLPDGTYGGQPAGFLLQFAEARVYFACDTALFSDMKRIGEGGLDLAVLPIGDLFTMGPEDSIEAIRLLNPKRVAPAHYNTWPPIEQDADAWAAQVRENTSATPVVLEPGGSIRL